MVKNQPANAGDIKDSGLMWVRKIPWRRTWEPTPVFLLGKSHVQRSLRGYSPWGCKRVGHDLTTEHTRTLYNSYHSGKAVLELARHISLVIFTSGSSK